MTLGRPVRARPAVDGTPHGAPWCNARAPQAYARPRALRMRSVRARRGLLASAAEEGQQVSRGISILLLISVGFVARMTRV